VVDDDVSVRESVSKVLGGADYDSVLAAGGLEAVARCHSNDIDLVLLDIGLPNQSGWETCQHLAREHAKAPIIVITGQSGQIKPALAAGAAGLMEKPLDADRLLQMIQLLLAKSNAPDPYRSKGIFYHIGA